MNSAHLHLVFNHFPIVGTIIGAMILTVGILLKKKDISRTALGVFVFTAFSAMLALYTGNEAEEIVENLPDISETLLHTHEELAESFLFLSLALGATSALAFIFDIRKYKYSQYLISFVLLLAIGNGALAKFVGTSGGEIRHSEIRSDEKMIHIHLDDNDHHDDH